MSDALTAARELLLRHPVIDGHNDLPWEIRERFGSDPATFGLPLAGQTHTDLRRLRQGGVGGQFWSVYVPGTFTGDAAVTATLQQADLVHRMIRQFPGDLELALTATDVEAAVSRGHVASLLGAEGGHCIASSTAVLRSLHRLGVRYLTLTHNFNVPWADAATDEPAVGGLSELGAVIVREMQRIGMMADLSHVAPAAARDVLEIAEAPVIFSHSSAQALCGNPRNVPDDILRRLAANGGVCMIAFVPAFVSRECRAWDLGVAAEMRARGLDAKDLELRSAIRDEYARAHPRPAATLADVADHIDHVRAVAGVEHVGIGADYDGTDILPDGLEDVSCYPALIAEMLARGWGEDDCARLAGGNVLRVLRETEAFASDLRQGGPD